MIPIARPIIEAEEIEAITAVLKSGKIAQGEIVAKFEKAFAEYTGVEYAIAVSSGTAALHIALLCHGIGAGDEVITTPFSFIATASAIMLAGGRPVFADIDEKTFNISPESIESKITNNTKAIIPVHLYGQPCDMTEIMEIAGAHGLTVIEDACQAHGAEYRGKKVGTFGTGCFSFYPTKNMTTGEGGIITTNNREIAEKARLLRSHGQKERYYHETLGYNYRMTDIAAAIGISQLVKLDAFNNRRIENARLLTDRLDGTDGLTCPYVMPGVKHVFHQYTVRVTKDFNISRDGLKAKLQDEGIGSDIYYPLPIHMQPIFKGMGYYENLPNTGQAAREVLSLPVHPSLSGEDLEYIASRIKECHAHTAQYSISR